MTLTHIQEYIATDSDGKAQFMLGFFHATGLGGIEQDQGKVGPIVKYASHGADDQALAYYTFSALQGYRPAEMALAYRHWSGISVKEVSILGSVLANH